MTRRLLSAAALVIVLGVPARAAAKPPDLPMNQTDTVTPQAVPILAHPLLSHVYDDWESDLGRLVGMGNCKPPKLVQDVSAEELPSAKSVYDSLPPALPTPTLYQLRPTARRTLAGSLLFGFNPLLALLPTDKALDAPGDHPQRVAGEDVFSDIPKVFKEYGIWSSGGSTFQYEDGDWLKWIMSHWSARHAAPAPEKNEGYINGIHPVTTIAAVTAEDAPAEIDAPLVPTAEALPMPKEDKPYKTKHKKHHPKGERLPMPQVDTADGVTCPYLRQQAADRHACQLADPQIGRDVLDNLESLKAADTLLEMAELFARAGCFGEAMECCAFAQDLCPGSPCANRAAGVMAELYVRACELVIGTEESSEKSSGIRSDDRAIEKTLNRPVIMNYIKTPLREVIDDLRAFQVINIYVDAPALAEKGITLDTPISVKLEGITFKSALNLILHSAHLVYVVKDDGVQITTKEYAARGKLSQHIYEVTDLLGHKELPKGYKGKARKDGKSNADRLIELITNTILPRSWSDQGGPGTIEFYPPTQSLAINQTADVQDQIQDLLAALRRRYDEESETKEASGSEAKTRASKKEPGVEQQVNGLMKACRLLVNEGLHEQAAELARQAFALDPERVMADPLIYKMHLLATSPAPSGSSESAEPPSCPYCPRAGEPIHGVVPGKKKTKSGPTTFLVPVMPPVDYEVVPALDRVLTETAKPAAGAEEASEEDAASSLDELIETITGGPGQATFGFGVNGDGSLRLSGECSSGGTVYHVLFNRGCLAIWKTPDAAKIKP